MMENDQERQYTIKAGELPPGSEQYDYNGDMQPTLTVGALSTPTAANPTAAPLIAAPTPIVGAPPTSPPTAESLTIGAPSTVALPEARSPAANSLRVAPPTAISPVVGETTTVRLSQKAIQMNEVKKTLEEMLKSDQITVQEINEYYRPWYSYFRSTSPN
jgi:hypothetical protein